MKTEATKIEKTVKFENIKIHSEKIRIENYFELAKSCVNNPSDSLPIDEIRGRLELIALFDTKEDFVYMNIKQVNKLIGIISSTRWVVVDKVIIDFADYVTGLKELF